MSLQIARELVTIAKELVAGIGIYDLIGKVGQNMGVQIATPDEGKILFVGKFNGNQTEFWPRRNSSVGMLVQCYYVRIKWPGKTVVDEVLPGQRYVLEISVATAGGHSGFNFEIPLVLGANPERDVERVLKTVIPTQVNRILKRDAKRLIEVAESIHKQLIEDYSSGRYMGD